MSHYLTKRQEQQAALDLAGKVTARIVCTKCQRAPAVMGRRRCGACLEMARTGQMGLCSGCHTRPAKTGRRMCADCAQAERDRMRRVRQSLHESGSSANPPVVYRVPDKTPVAPVVKYDGQEWERTYPLEWR